MQRVITTLCLLSLFSCKARNSQNELSNVAAVSGFASPYSISKDLPPPGTYSQFDAVFSDGSGRLQGYSIPSKFEDVMRKVEDATGQLMLGVLFPLSRSLQRFASKPNYFKYPRIVAATDFKTKDGSGAQPANNDFIFLGYNEIAKSIEAIS